MPTKVELTPLDRPSIDAEYDPERRAGPRGPFLDWYTRQSALARKQLECLQDFPTGRRPRKPSTSFPRNGRARRS